MAARLEMQAPPTTNDSITVHVLERYHPTFATQYQLHEYRPIKGFHIVLSFQASSTGRDCFRPRALVNDSSTNSSSQNGSNGAHVWVPDDSWRLASLQHQRTRETFCVDVVESTTAAPAQGTMTYIERLSSNATNSSVMSSSIGVESETAGRFAFRTIHAVKLAFRPLSYRVWQQLPILTLIKSAWVTPGTEDELPEACLDRAGNPIANVARPRGNVKDDRIGGPKLALCVESVTISTHAFLVNDTRDDYMTGLQIVAQDRRRDAAVDCGDGWLAMRSGPPNDASAMRVPVPLNQTHNYFVCYRLAPLLVSADRHWVGSEDFVQELSINETATARDERIRFVRHAPLTASPARIAVSETIVNEWW
ncbi:hypothetical protein PINS_up006027 [Pythium insidiosum]|nr:hypothetical protein PINS_up006027 [Pythium insidiosum]